MKKPTVKSTTVITIQAIVITMLVTGIGAFISGMKYQAHVNNQVKAEAKSIVSLKN